MKRDIVKQLAALTQKAWEEYVKLPTNDNREKFERLDDDLRVELEFDRVSSLDADWTSSSPDISVIISYD